jgi:hypothetical protein
MKISIIGPGLGSSRENGHATTFRSLIGGLQLCGTGEVADAVRLELDSAVRGRRP